MKETEKYICESFFNFPCRRGGAIGIYDKNDRLMMSFSPLREIYKTKKDPEAYKIIIEEIVEILNGDRNHINLKNIKFSIVGNSLYMNTLVIGHVPSYQIMFAFVTKGHSDEQVRSWPKTYEARTVNILDSLKFMIKKKLNGAMKNSKYEETKPLVIGIINSLQRNFNIIESLKEHAEKGLSQNG